MPIMYNTWSATDKAVRMLAQASGNESGGITSKGANKGDQYGGEVNAVAWYQHTRKWGKVYRLTDSTLAEAVAKNMEDAVTNGYIGYDTQNRHSFRSALDAAGGVIRRIQTPCDTDCSCLGYHAIKLATGVSCEVDWAAFISALWRDLGWAVADNDELTEMFQTATSAELATVYNLLRNQATPSPYTDPMCGGFAPSATNSVGFYLKVRQFDYYMERVLPLAGVDVEVYTISNKDDNGAIRDGTAYNSAALDDNNETYYLYESPFDSYDQYVDSGDVATLKAHLTFSVSNNNEAWLTGSELLQRGDILRTRAPAPTGGSGHVAVWI